MTKYIMYSMNLKSVFLLINVTGWSIFEVEDVGYSYIRTYTCIRIHMHKRSYMIYHAIWKNLFKFILVMGEVNRGLWSSW
jgi:hypothetical protein